MDRAPTPIPAQAGMKRPTPQYPALIYDGAYGTPPGPDINRMKNVTPKAEHAEPAPERTPTCRYYSTDAEGIEHPCQWGLDGSGHAHLPNGDVVTGQLADAARAAYATRTLKAKGTFSSSGPWGKRTR